MKQTPWFERSFAPQTDNGLLPNLLERLEGAPDRLEAKIRRMAVDNLVVQDGRWSLKKEIGHLIDLEPLWYGRFLQLRAGAADLAAADLSNRRTHETDHDATPIGDLIDQFRVERNRTVELLRSVSEAELQHAARHPRLGTPMRILDLAFFVAEHDDHHLARMTALQE